MIIRRPLTIFWNIIVFQALSLNVSGSRLTCSARQSGLIYLSTLIIRVLKRLGLGVRLKEVKSGS
jgi:hypothetical protein